MNARTGRFSGGLSARKKVPVPGTCSEGSQSAVDLEFESVRHAFLRGKEVTQVLDDVSLTVAPGEFVGIVGPSGCGKTTLLGMAAGMLRPSRGAVRFGGVELSSTSSEVAANGLKVSQSLFNNEVKLLKTVDLLGSGSANYNQVVAPIAQVTGG